MRDAERQTAIAVSKVWEPAAPLAVLISSGDDVVENKNGNGYEWKNVNRSRRVKLEHAEQIKNHQYCKD